MLRLRILLVFMVWYDLVEGLLQILCVWKLRQPMGFGDARDRAMHFGIGLFILQLLEAGETGLLLRIIVILSSSSGAADDFPECLRHLSSKLELLYLVVSMAAQLQILCSDVGSRCSLWWCWWFQLLLVLCDIQ